MAAREFTFLSDSAAAIEVVTGDARLLLAPEPDRAAALVEDAARASPGRLEPPILPVQDLPGTLYNCVDAIEQHAERRRRIMKALAVIGISYACLLVSPPSRPAD